MTTRTIGSIVRKIAYVIERILVLLLAVLLLLPVALLPLTTTVPMPVWGALFLADAALFALQDRLKPVRVGITASLVERYYNVLEAPHKELIWLDGGHGLDGSNIGQFVDVMVNKVLPETYPTQTIIPLRSYTESALFVSATLLCTPKSNLPVAYGKARTLST